MDAKRLDLSREEIKNTLKYAFLISQREDWIHLTPATRISFELYPQTTDGSIVEDNPNDEINPALFRSGYIVKNMVSSYTSQISKKHEQVFGIEGYLNAKLMDPKHKINYYEHITIKRLWVHVDIVIYKTLSSQDKRIRALESKLNKLLTKK